MGQGRRIRLAAFVAALVALVGCATAYQSRGFTGGFSETQLGENIFRVSFEGNEFTDNERAVDFTMLRCAELALQNGSPYFIVVEASSDNSLSTYTTPSRAYTTGSVQSYGNTAFGSANTTIYGGQTYLLSAPRSENTIVLLREKPEDAGVVYEARFVFDSISTKYGMNQPVPGTGP